MPATAHRPAPPRHALRPTPPAACATVRLPVVAPRRPPLAGAPPAGLGPWVPPLPAPQPQMTPRVWAALGAGALVLLAGLTVVVSMVLGAAPARPDADAAYLSAVRAASGLSSTEVSDTVLVGTGQAVCAALDRSPTEVAVLSVLRAIVDDTGWSGDDSAIVVVSAIGTYCPGHTGLVDV